MLITQTGWDGAFAATIGAGIMYLVAPLLRKRIDKTTEEFDHAARIRTELRHLIDDLQARQDAMAADLDRLHKEVDEWRGKYYVLLEAHLEHQAQYAALLEEFGQVKRKYGYTDTEIA